MSIANIILKLKSWVTGYQEVPKKLIDFDTPSTIYEDSAQDIAFVDNEYPSKADLPQKSNEKLKKWQDGCIVLISGISIPVGMKYEDSQGETTSRKIEVKKIYRSSDGIDYLSGFCYLRKAYRNFRTDRISEIVSLETGEIYRSPQAFIEQYGIFSTPQLEKLQIFIHILSYLARADRNFDDCELNIISALVDDYAQGESKERILSYARSHKPTKKDYLAEVEKLRFFDRKDLSYLVIMAERLINADGKVTKKESEFFDVLKSSVESLK